MAEIYSTGNTAVVTAPSHQHRLSWGAIFAGLVTALGVMILLSVLGLAVGLSAVSADDQPRHIGMGAGIWGAISALVSFFIGGWVAGWAKPGGYTASGLTQGVLMWMVATVLLAYLIAGGVGAALRTAGSVAKTGVEASAQVAGASAQVAANNPDVRQDAVAATQQAADQVQQGVERARQAVSPENVERAAEIADDGAWGALISLVLSLGAAAAGGHLGGNSDRDRHRHA
jgi:hypothetical protein